MLDGKVKKPCWRLLRVNQLWIWTIGESMTYTDPEHGLILGANIRIEWLITAANDPVDDSKDSLLNGIVNYLNKLMEEGGSGTQPGTASEMSQLIVDYCISSFERKIKRDNDNTNDENDNTNDGNDNTNDGNDNSNDGKNETISIRQMFSSTINQFVCRAYCAPWTTRLTSL